MKAILICPSPRSAVPLLSENAPLAAAPLLGQSLIEYWLSYLACAGARQVTVLAHDRSERVSGLAGDGARWGLEVTTIAESRELTPGQALLKHAPELGAIGAQSGVALLDHLPGLAERPILTSYADWFQALCEWMPRAVTPDRVGIRQTAPGIWVACRARVARDAQLRAPCWVGDRACVGAGARLGPCTVVEDGAVIDSAAELAGSWIGPDTFVGRFAEVANSLAWGNALLKWQNGSLAKVADPFLLCALRQPRAGRAAGWRSRLAELRGRSKDEGSLFWKHLLLNKNS